jgi:hypothetical protein
MDVKDYPPLMPLEALAVRKRKSAKRYLDLAVKLTAEAEQIEQAAAERRRLLQAAS